MTGHIEQRGLASWIIVVNRGKDPINGKRKMVSKVFNGPKREAERIMHEMLQQHQNTDPD